jgi:hypothetical protein
MDALPDPLPMSKEDKNPYVDIKIKIYTFI